MEPMMIKEIEKAVDGKIFNYKEISIANVCTDSRKIAEGDLFVPLKGEKFDGHDFVLDSFEKGACLTLSDRELNTDKPYILVSDTRDALKKLAKYYLGTLNVKIIAVTGSVGKTTTKDIIASVLSQKFKTLKTEGNFNNEIGLPLTVFRIGKEHEAAVLEMGMNNFGEIRALSDIANPDAAVITNIGVSHIENLGSREGILKAKSEIFENLKPGGVGILNCDDDMQITLKNKLSNKIYWYGINNKEDYFADNIVPNSILGTRFTLHTPKGSRDVNIKIPGEHMVYNALCAAAVGDIFGVDLDGICAGIESFQPTKMRMDITVFDTGLTLINDAYNANPVSMKAALDVLKTAKGRRIAILGDMFELGADSEKMHAEIGAYAFDRCDILICIGKESIAMYDAAIQDSVRCAYFETQEDFLNSDFKKGLYSDDVILVKASRGMHLEKTVEMIQEVNE